MLEMCLVVLLFMGWGAIGAEQVAIARELPVQRVFAALVAGGGLAFGAEVSRYLTTVGGYAVHEVA
jgi:hypothetical protein